jgi:hypothetical protein
VRRIRSDLRRALYKTKGEYRLNLYNTYSKRFLRKGFKIIWS